MIYQSESVIKEWEVGKKMSFTPPKKETPTELQSADDLEKQKRTQLALALGSE